MAITLQLEREDNLRVNKETGGLEDSRIDPWNQLPQENFKETELNPLDLKAISSKVMKRFFIVCICELF